MPQISLFTLFWWEIIDLRHSINVTFLLLTFLTILPNFHYVHFSGEAGTTLKRSREGLYASTDSSRKKRQREHF